MQLATLCSVTNLANVVISERVLVECIVSDSDSGALVTETETKYSATLSDTTVGYLNGTNCKQVS